MSQTLRNGFSKDLAIQPGEILLVAAPSGSYSASIIAGVGAGTAIATSATGGTYGPYATSVVIRLTSSAISEVDYDFGTAPAIVSDTPVMASTNLTGEIENVQLGGWTYGLKGLIPAAQDYASVVATLKAAMTNGSSKTVQFQDAVYDLGANYLPLVSGVEYLGVEPLISYTAGDWGDRNVGPVGGTRFTTTNDYVFWDGAVDQVAITPTVAPQASTATAGSALISVPNSSLFPAGARVYVPSDACGFLVGQSYFVLTSAANVITLGLADKVAIVATESGAVSVASGKPNDGTSNCKLKNLIGLGVKTFIKAGAKNTFGFLYSEVNGIWALGGATKRVLVDHTNYSQSTFERIFTYDGDGQNHGCDYPLGVFIPGNSTFKHIFNANNGVGSSSLTQRGIRFQCEDGSNLNEVHAYTIQNNNSLVTTVTQAATTAAASADIAVADGAQFPVDTPFWFSAVGSNTTISQDLIYFVISQSGNTIQVATSKRGAVVTPSHTGAVTINTKGLPSLEILAIGTGYITSSSFDGIDVEADATTHILAQQIGSCEIGILQCAADQTKWGFTARTVNGIVHNIFEKTTTDIDKNCRLMWFGNRTGAMAGANSYSGPGLWYDKSTDMVAISLHHDSTISGGIPASRPAFQGMKPSPMPWVKAWFPIGYAQYTQDVTKALTGSSPVGHIIFNGAAAQTFTLPAIIDAAAKTSMVGYNFEITNASANALAIATSSSQTFNNIAAKTSFNLAANTHCKLIGSKTGGGTLFWTVYLSAALP